MVKICSSVCATLIFAAGLMVLGAPPANATVCGSVGGARGSTDQREWMHLEMGASLEPTPEQFAALAARPADEPVVMVNLLQFKADGGRASYLRYTREVAPHLQRVGGTVRYAGASPSVVIGDGVKPWWDAIIVVEYPSPAAGLDRGDLIATSVWTMAE